MISIIEQVPAGGALRLVMQPQAGSTSIRVTRGATQAELTGPDAGTIAYEGADLSFLDGPGLVNGTPLWYRAFYKTGSTWLATDASSKTPVASFADYSADPLGLVQDALTAGFVELVRRFTAGVPTMGPKLNPKSGSIAVLNGTPAFESVQFPVVTLHMADDDGTQQRFLGELPQDDTPDVDGMSNDVQEGWLSSVQITICGWSLNYDERKALRQAIKLIVMANLPIFDAAGLINPGLRMSDQDDTTSYTAPIYQAIGTFTCSAPSLVGAAQPRVNAVEVSVNVNGDVYV